MVVGHDFSVRLKQVRVKKKTITRTIRDVIADLQSAKITIPSYQRTFVWETDKQCRFIESIFMDIPIPPLFLLEKFSDEASTTIFEIIDGVQRLTTLENFYGGKLRLSNLDTLADLNQTTFPTLPPNISGIFLEREINIIIIESDTHPEIQFEVFGRLNQGSVSLNAQELRNCMFHGAFNDFLIHDCSRKTQYKELLAQFPKFQVPKEGKPDKNRGLNVELILRFFALYEFYKPESNQYPDSRAEILNDYMRARIASEKDTTAYPNLKTTEELENLLDKVTRMVSLVFNGNHFKSFSVKKDRAEFAPSLNQSIFDVQMLGLAEYEEEDIKDLIDVIYDSFLDLSTYDRNFIDAVSRSTNHKVSIRVGIWKNQLQKIIEDPTTYKQNLLKKQTSFANNPVCSATGNRLESFDEADYYGGKIYHKYNSPRTETVQSNTRKTHKTPISAHLEGSDYAFDDIHELIDFVLVFISERIQDSEFDIKRLASLECIGTNASLSAKSKHQLKKFKEVGVSLDNKKLYFDVGGGRSEIKQFLQDLAGLFSFSGDFEIID